MTQNEAQSTYIMENTKLIELDKNKEYVLVAKRGSVKYEDLVLPKGSEYKKRIPIIWVDDLSGIAWKEGIFNGNIRCPRHDNALRCLDCQKELSHDAEI